MNKRAFFLGAVLLAFIALLTHSVARHYLEDGIHRHVIKRIEQMQMPQTAYTPDSQVLRSSRLYKSLTTGGIVLTALSVVCMAIAMVRHEKGWYLILILLLFFDVVAPMLL